jgi:mandelamide amidase
MPKSARPPRLTAGLAFVLLASSLTTHAQDYLDLSAADAARLIREGKLSSRDLVTALLKQIDAGSDLHAFILIERGSALRAAEEADRKREQGVRLGPLHGVPIVIKDNIHLAGLPNTAGTPALRGFVPGDTAPVAQALIDAGAIVLGKTNMHELALGITSNNAAFGAVVTPYDKRRFAGGSSGGTAAAIAARMAPAGLGTDTGGSVRIPAALNGIVGLRPTVGRYSQQGITPLSHTRDTAGPMARTVRDLVLLDQVISGDLRSIPMAAPSGIRLGVVRIPFCQNIDGEVAQIFELSLQKLRGAGVQLVDVELPDLADVYAKAGPPMAAYEVKADLAAYLANYQTGLTVRAVVDQVASPDVKRLFETVILGDKAPTDAVYREAVETHLPRLRQLYADAFAERQLDALIFPTTPLPAQPLEQSIETKLNGKTVSTFFTFLANTRPSAFVHLPGLALPMGMTADGLPVGIELDGPAGTDRRLLSIGLALESVLGPVPPPQR